MKNKMLHIMDLAIQISTDKRYAGKLWVDARFSGSPRAFVVDVWRHNHIRGGTICTAYADAPATEPQLDKCLQILEGILSDK